MKTYILIECNDEGVRTCLTTKAKDAGEAIEKFNYFPFTEGDFDDRRLTLEERKQVVYEFYGLKGVDACRRRGNYVDGDSSSEYVIIEVGDRVRLFPPVVNVLEKIDVMD